MNRSRTKSNQNTEATETFNKLSSQIKALIQRITSSHKVPSSSSASSSSLSSSTNKKKSKRSINHQIASSSYNFPLPDEANVALGKQLGSVYTSMYFDCKCWQNDKLKSQWRDVGFDFFDTTFCGIVTNGENTNANSGKDDGTTILNKSVITSFFNQLMNGIVSQLDNKKDQVESGSKSDQSTQIIDDICYWWIAIMTHCEKRIDSSPSSLSSVKITTRNNQFLSFILQSSIRSYVAFAFRAYLHLQQLKMKNGDISSNNTTSSLSYTFAEKTNIHDHHVNENNNDDDDDDDHMQLIRLYNKIELNQYRQVLIREIVNSVTTLHLATTNDESTTIHQQEEQQRRSLIFMTPLIQKILINATTSSSKQHDHEHNLNVCISCVMGACSSLQNQFQNVKNDNGKVQNSIIINSFVSITSWLIRNCYESLLDQYEKLSSSRDDPKIVYITNLIHELGCQLCDIITNLVMKTKDHPDFIENSNGLAQYFLNLILCQVLTFYTSLEQGSVLTSISIDTILQRVIRLLSTIYESPKIQFRDLKISNNAVYRSVITALLLHDENQIQLQLELCSYLAMIEDRNHVNGQESEFSSIIWASIYCLGSIFSSTPSWDSNTHANKLIELSMKQLQGKRSIERGSQDIIPTKTIAQMYLQDQSTYDKVTFLNTMSDQLERKISTTTNQAETMMFALSLIVEAATSTDSNELDTLFNAVYSVFDRVLEVLPHLGRRSLIVLKGILQCFISTKSIPKVQRLLEFICGSMSRDASCAHEIWAMISTMINPTVASVKVQSMILRLYPILCNSNKRLYGRICESIGKYVTHPNSQLRLVTASTICELAKEDLIRDVSDVIGWVQAYLEDEEDLIVYQAILSLYYLVLAGDLDYVIVLKVLNKKLVKFNDGVSDVLSLSDVVIEAFVKFLGIGELADDDDDDDESESEDEDDHEKETPPHIQLSIKTLCNLALSGNLIQCTTSSSHEVSKMYILEQLYESLSQYSAESFGIDEDVICQDEYEEDNLYFQLRKIVDSGISLVESCDFFNDNKRFDASVKKLVLTIEAIEQHSPVSMRWLQQHRKMP